MHRYRSTTWVRAGTGFDTRWGASCLRIHTGLGLGLGAGLGLGVCEYVSSGIGTRLESVLTEVCFSYKYTTVVIYMYMYIFI